MGVEWDPAKEAANAKKHNIRFEEAVKVFRDPAHIIERRSRSEFGEERLLAIGQVDPWLITVIYTNRTGNRRLSSARRARRDERGKYRQGPTSA